MKRPTPVSIVETNEWLEPDGRGGFASGTARGIRTRRYHALLLTSTTPPTGRFVLVNGFDAWVDTASRSELLTEQVYAPGHIDGEAPKRVKTFHAEPWPTWTYRLDDGTEIEHEVFGISDPPVVVVTFRRVGRSRSPLGLTMRPFLSGRDIHALHHENSSFRFDAEVTGERIQWHPYEGLPAVSAASNGRYAHEPVWYRDFLYREERARGLDHVEDLASPGTLTWDLSQGPAVLVLSAAATPDDHSPRVTDSIVTWVEETRRAESERRAAASSGLHRAAEAYIVRRGDGKTIVAGYPWFTDWGRDTFIAMRGLCLATGRLDVAKDILLAWADTVSEGMLPNRFVEQGDQPEFNSVDAALWYAVAVGEFLEAIAAGTRRLAAPERRTLIEARDAILRGHVAGTRHGIRLDEDGLLAAGAPGVQLTWMDAKVGDWVVTPRIGKPVEIQALWLNALLGASGQSKDWLALYQRGRESFGRRFWNERRGCLYDVVDVDHRPGEDDDRVRPNQIFAVGGLPIGLLDADRARRVVETVESRLWTPLGLRTLATDDPGYRGRYEGGVVERDGVYHQGTVWPWLLGPFVEAWVRVRGETVTARRTARSRFVDPIRHHLDEAGLGHVSEIADGDAPHTPRGCPFQAWSVGEMLRLTAGILGEERRASRPRTTTTRRTSTPSTPRRRPAKT